jgi:dihydropteroate synthase
MLWQTRQRTLEIGRRPLVAGIVNVTPDSFSDGGRFLHVERAIEHGLRLADEGADILDIGGESTRPGAEPVSEAEELARVIPVIEALHRERKLPLSIDTMKPAVAAAALDAGAEIINDVSGFRDPEMIRVAAAFHAGVIVMHMQGMPATMQADPRYEDVAQEVIAILAERTAALVSAGLPEACVCVDPGIGFGKTQAHNLELLGRLGEFRRLGRPVCLGVSRKGFIGSICGRTVEERVAGSLAVACFAADRGEAHVLRVHDVAATRDAMRMLEAIPRRAASL